MFTGTARKHPNPLKAENTVRASGWLGNLFITDTVMINRRRLNMEPRERSKRRTRVIEYLWS